MRAELREALRPYRDRYPDARWTLAETWHLTLLFLGEVQPVRVAELERLMDDVASHTRPYDVRADRGGGRTGRRDGVAWLGLGAGASELIAAADALVADCPPDIAGGKPPRRTPSAHVTVARRADGQVVDALRTPALGDLDVAWHVDRLCLVRSHLETGGARYVTLDEVSL